MSNLHVLSTKPQLCYQQMVNWSGAGSQQSLRALELLQASQSGFIEWLNRPNSSRDVAIMSIVAHAEVNSLGFSQDGSTLVAALKDGKLKMWKTSTGEQIAVLAGHTK